MRLNTDSYRRVADGLQSLSEDAKTLAEQLAEHAYPPPPGQDAISGEHAWQAHQSAHGHVTALDGWHGGLSGGAALFHGSAGKVDGTDAESARELGGASTDNGAPAAYSSTDTGTGGRAEPQRPASNGNTADAEEFAASLRAGPGSAPWHASADAFERGAAKMRESAEQLASHRTTVQSESDGKVGDSADQWLAHRQNLLFQAADALQSHADGNRASAAAHDKALRDTPHPDDFDNAREAVYQANQDRAAGRATQADVRAAQDKYTGLVRQAQEASDDYQAAMPPAPPGSPTPPPAGDPSDLDAIDPATGEPWALEALDDDSEDDGQDDGDDSEDDDSQQDGLLSDLDGMGSAFADCAAQGLGAGAQALGSGAQSAAQAPQAAAGAAQGLGSGAQAAAKSRFDTPLDDLGLDEGLGGGSFGGGGGSTAPMSASDPGGFGGLGLTAAPASGMWGGMSGPAIPAAASSAPPPIASAGPASGGMVPPMMPPPPGAKEKEHQRKKEWLAVGFNGQPLDDGLDLARVTPQGTDTAALRPQTGKGGKSGTAKESQQQSQGSDA